MQPKCSTVFLTVARPRPRPETWFIALQLLKGLENQVVILLGYPRAIIRNLEEYGRAFLPPPDENSPIRAIMVLNGVIDEIAQDKVERRPRRQD